MNKNFSIFCGVDVSKDWIDISIGETSTRLKQTQGEINKFIRKNINQPNETIVVLESTGGYEQLPAECFDEAGITVHIAHPNRVRAFAKAKGLLAKNDKLDAALLSDYGRFLEPNEIRSLQNKLTLKLKAFNSRLIQLKELHHQETCRLGMARCKGIKRTHQVILNSVEKQIKHVEQEMLTLIQTDKELLEIYKRVQTMKGVGPNIALAITATLPELGKVNKKEIAALVGVAPVTKESGKQRGRAMIQYGRPNIRKILYMGALIAIRYDVKMKAFYERLRNAGKNKKVGIVAVMRKMIVIMNVMIANKTDYCPNY